MSRKRKSPARLARRAFDQRALSRICTMPEEDFAAEYGMTTVSVEPDSVYRHGHDNDGGYYHFRDNGSHVLAVAHLDTVAERWDRTAYFADTKAGPIVFSRALDDRLGAYIILDLLPKLGITCDWLLTTGEERGSSTAEFFEPPKEYDWAIEFDRGGTDVVMYQYEDDESVAAVEAAGAEVGRGIFSDIAYLDHLKVKAFNWGVGYQQYHGPRSHAFLDDTLAMVGRFLRFHEQNAGRPMPHYGRRSYLTSYRDYDGYREYGDGTCLICGTVNAVEQETKICASCGACQDCLEDEADCTCEVRWYAERAEAEKEEGGLQQEAS